MVDGRRDDEKRRRLLTRRDFLKAGAAAGSAAALARSALSPSHERLLERVSGAASGTFDPSAVKHVVVLMQENRSFDHYFGTLNGVAGFGDTRTYATGTGAPTPWQQAGPLSALPGWTGATSGGTVRLSPWQLVSNPPKQNGQTTNDITHDWTPQHQAWNGGAMDKWFATHAGVDKNTSLTAQLYASSGGLLGTPTTNDGYMTMGYLTRPDVAFYHALADAFTICDGYFCSVMGPTDPNRLMLMSNSVGVGQANGPLLTTLVQTRPQEVGKLGWKTMPEALDDAKVSWKVYGDPTAQALFNVLPYFKQYESNATLAANTYGPQYPAGFAADVAAGTLPQVSWILPPAANCEHPAAPPEYGEYLVSQILHILTTNEDVWEQTVFILTYDENGGWFDHVPPPTSAASGISTDELVAQGEWVRGLTGQGYVDGPVGLGFRVPCIVISPFSRGGYVCSPYAAPTNGITSLDPNGTFDHTSINRFIATVFGAQGYDIALPNLSAWRQSVTGDLTAAFPGVNDISVPKLPFVSMADPVVVEQGVLNALLGTESDEPQPYPSPTDNQTFPPAPDGGGLIPTFTPA
ncbi:MAG: phospholipase C [Acidimicrobiales bacterium]